MNKAEKITLMLAIFILFTSLVSAAEISSFDTNNLNVYYFYGNGCPHCANVEASGVLEKVNTGNVILQRFEIYNNATSRDFFIQMSGKVGLSDTQRGVPLVIIEYNNSYSYLLGDKPIIADLEKVVADLPNVGPVPNPVPVDPNARPITLWSIIIAAAVDSINPCAFGVLAFLMICLLKIGSSKRALKAGLIYSFVVFSVYFLSGFGLFKVIQSFTLVSHYIYLGAGILVLFLGVTQFIDLFWPGKFISLRIPVKAKPFIEKIASRGTLPAVILLGIAVSLFELPCTGGVYIGILTLMAQKGTFAWGYLFLYNLIFILPLLLITLIIYKGTSPETVERWSQNEKSWMKIGSGAVMVALGIYILMSVL